MISLKYITVLFDIQLNLFDIIIYCASSEYLWLHIQSALNVEVSVWIYGYYTVEILNMLNHGVTPC
jgi:hypothetical protein